MIFSSLSKREKLILIAVGLLLCISILWGLVVDPFVKKWFDLNNQIRVKEVKLEKYIRLLDKYETVKSEYKKYSSLVKGRQTDEKYMAGILSEIEEIARKSNAYISVLKPNIVKSTSFYQKFIVEVELDTTMEDLTKFFYQLQRSPSILKVDSMEMAARSDQKGTIKCRLLISRILFLE